MGTVTALHSAKGRGKRVNVFIDGKFALSLEAEVAAIKGLKVEKSLSASQIQELAMADRFQRCLNAAKHYLSYRPRSESELRQRLQRRGFDSDTREEVITKLKQQGLVDDTSFAQFWKENRESFSPRSRWLTGLELKRKGVSNEIIERVVDTIDDNDSAYHAAIAKARSLASSEYQVFRRRLGEYLKRRGFGYGVINHTVEKMWREIADKSPDPENS